MTADTEFSRMIDRRQIKAEPEKFKATPDECAALARRFAIVAVKSLNATVSLAVKGNVISASATMKAGIVQNCAISGAELPVSITEKLILRFVPSREITDEEIELEADELDEIAYEGTAFDVGEAVAQSLALAIDPYLTGPDAERVRDEVGLAEKAPSGPLQEALAKLKKG